MSVIKKIFLSLILVSAILFIVEIDKIYAADTPDSVMAGADSFITDGEKNVSYNKDELHNTSNFLYNLLLWIRNYSGSYCRYNNRNKVYDRKHR